MESMDITEIRKLNLKAAIKQAGGANLLAGKINSSPSYFSQIINPTHRAQVGHKLARRIEQALELESGWMDVYHPEQIKKEPENKEEQGKQYLKMFLELSEGRREDALNFVRLLQEQERIIKKYSR